jgi:hypothetical protein
MVDRFDLDLPRLLQARSVTAERLRRRSELLAAAELPDDVAVVFVGSWGRREVTRHSDDDFYVLSHAGSEDAVENVKEALRRDERGFREPGREGVFANGTVSLRTLLENIGLEGDTNANLTQRMLLVLESVAVHNAGFHATARQEVLDSYLEAPIKACQPPRLLLNDVVRYWRTMCVDFAGKMRNRDGEGWGLRNAKLRTTRKLLFASGLLPLMRCGQLDADRIAPFLAEQLALPPADRVADAFLDLDLQDAARDLFGAYEAFLGAIDSDATRRTLDAIKSRAEADESKAFQAVARLGTAIESALLAALFDSPLSETTRRYAIF